jgi:CO dehydrogenase maturation factor
VERSGDVELVVERTGLPVLAAVPHDPVVAAAERLGRAPFDQDPDAPAVEAVRSLLTQLRSMEDAG